MVSRLRSLKRCPPMTVTLHKFLTLCWSTGLTPTQWKHSHTKLLYKKGDPTLVDNYRPIGLLVAIGKLWTSCITLAMSDYADKHKLMHHAQEGFLRERNTIRQLTHWIALIEHSHLKKTPFYGLYVDFVNFFPSVDHNYQAAAHNEMARLPRERVRSSGGPVRGRHHLSEGGEA